MLGKGNISITRNVDFDSGGMFQLISVLHWKKKGKRKNRSRKGNIYYATIIKLDVIYTR